MRNPSHRRARTVRSGLVALACAAGALLTLPAQAAWLVSDTRAQEILRQIQTNTDNTVKRIEDFRDKEQPKWSGGGNTTYNPYTKWDSDATKYKYTYMQAGTERDEQLHMKLKCNVESPQTYTDQTLWQVPEVGGGGLGGELGGGAGGGVKAKQDEICMRLVAAENRRFKEIIAMMNRIQQRDQALKQLAQNRGSISESGQLAVNSNNLLLFIADSQVEIQYGQARIAAYDSLINSLNLANDVNANEAINGDSALGSVTRLAALKAALEIID